ncbi:hypothetical protein [uncultured Paraglaciecola sp.]|mgnify:CR=1 FL=1|uniref:hypothetical protein n=1 Tax=uncultured Paraglaciecola sp. TaxID=1765024 RepID=UPI0030D7F954|tara:strand:+ start:125234 stop:125689 length:456 start_codon:yes stop_codon:yes gene_type:complete
MNKVLIGLGIILSAYLIYSAVSNEDTESNITTTEQNIEVKEKQEMYEEYQLSDDDQAGVYGTYAIIVENEKMAAKQVYTLNSDGTFDHTRTMSRPKDLSGNSTGSYVLNKNLITLTFAEDRDTTVFPLQIIEMALLKNGNLKSGNQELIKQ